MPRCARARAALMQTSLSIQQDNFLHCNLSPRYHGMEQQEHSEKRPRRTFFASVKTVEAGEAYDISAERRRLRRGALTSAAVRALALAIICSFLLLASTEISVAWKTIVSTMFGHVRTWQEAGDTISALDFADAVSARLTDPTAIAMVALIFVVCGLFGLREAARHFKLLEYQSKLESINQRLHEMSLRDDLTGLYNQRALKEQLDIELERGRRSRTPLTLYMLDVDYYKNVNDRYGHIFGDQVLAQLASIVKTGLRKIDVVARYGGDELVIILPSTDEKAALYVGHRIRRSVEEHVFTLEDIRASITVSIGGATCAPDESVVKSELMRRADEALYAAKQNGRNNVSFWKREVEGQPEVASTATAAGKKLDELQKKIYALSREAREMSVESVYALAAALEAKDGYTQRHSIAVMSLSTGIARAMLLPEEEVERIRNAALLHDIGKIGIGEEILLKEGPLTDGEITAIRQHPNIGASILAPIRYLRDLVPMVRHHHERWDGRGYPTGLKGEEIPIGARILAVADAYCAMTSDRSYCSAKTRDEASAELQVRAGTQFDPKVIEIFTQAVAIATTY